MFKVKINEKEYVVCSEGEFNFLGNMTSPVFTIPNYLDLDYKVGTQTVIKITNNVPIIIDESNLTNQDEFNRSINVNFEAIYPLELEEVENVHQVDKRIAESLKQMLSDARKEGLSPIICSSYRTNAKQQKLYNNKVREYKRWGCSSEEAEELASYWVAIPGTGEHETGLAVDIVSENYQILDEKQEQTDVQRWLIDNSYKYGFTLRYPTDKKDITMINYEPWHYRYVGIDNATYMKEHDMCLEEYIEYLKQLEEEDYNEIVL